MTALKIIKFRAQRASSWVFCALLLVGTSVSAAEGMDRLKAFFAQKGAMSAEFVQTVEGAAFAQADESRGTLLLLRPGKFRWDYKFPYPQVIIADGQRLWIYDVDLEQVIVKPLDSALGDTPALLLSGDGNVSERFEISSLADQNDQLLWMRLVPKKEDTGFKEIRLGFGPKHLLGMELVDGFDQVTRLVFSNVESGLTLPKDSFLFVPPEGVDVVGKEGKR